MIFGVMDQSYVMKDGLTKDISSLLHPAQCIIL